MNQLVPRNIPPTTADQVSILKLHSVIHSNHPARQMRYPPNQKATFDYLCQQAVSDADTMPPEQVENYTEIDDETIVRNLRRTSGNLLSDALNMALEEASQFVLEQNNETCSNTGQDYNLVELSPWDSNQANANAGRTPFVEGSVGYGVDTGTNAIANLDQMGMEVTSRGSHGQTQVCPQQGVNTNVQYEISSATNLLYGGDQSSFEADVYGNQQPTNLQSRHQNMLGLLNSGTVNNLSMQNTHHWQNSNNSLDTNQGNVPRPDGVQYPSVGF